LGNRRKERNRNRTTITPQRAFVEFATNEGVRADALFDVQLGIRRTDDAQMAGSEIVNRSPVEIRLDNRQTDIWRARNSHRVSASFTPTGSHGRAVFGKRDRHE